MMRKIHPLFFVPLFLFLSQTLAGQWLLKDDNLNRITEEKLKSHVYMLSDTTTRGRATGSAGATISANYIKHCFQRYGLMTYNGSSFFQSFRTGDVIGRNVVGMIRGRTYPMEFIVISAHYDHLGVLNGSVYPGADDNASGVALLLQVAELFARRARAGDGPLRSIIFVAYDAKELGLAGSAFFAGTLRVAPSRIMANLNIDQIGCTFEPPGRNPEYVLVLGADHPSPDLRMIIDMANRYYGIGLDIDHTYYGSRNISNFFFQTGDQIHLAKRNVPSILFTSGINAHTYKPTDLPSHLNYTALKKRTQLLYLVANDLASRRSWLRRW
ncbi:MAG: M28 family peptidase [Bacteroidales bacterium]|nr:M28 family peptidase [Bacteroidales bacterium]